MFSNRTKSIILLIVLTLTALLTGCTNYKKKYKTLKVEHENTLGLLEHARADREQLAGEVSERTRTIEQLQQQIAERKQTPAQAAGFGEGYDVSLDADAGTITVTLKTAILFDPGKATLKKLTSTELDHIYSVIRDKYRGRKVDVVGHTDSDPIKKSGWKDNWELSAQRALAVARYLLERGIPDEKTRAVGCGASQPRASNATASGKAKNRRVEIVVHLK